MFAYAERNHNLFNLKSFFLKKKNITFFSSFHYKQAQIIILIIIIIKFIHRFYYKSNNSFYSLSTPFSSPSSFILPPPSISAASPPQQCRRAAAVSLESPPRNGFPRFRPPSAPVSSGGLSPLPDQQRRCNRHAGHQEEPQATFLRRLVRPRPLQRMDQSTVLERRPRRCDPGREHKSLWDGFPFRP